MGGIISLVEEGDIIKIDIPNYSVHLAVDEDTLAERRAEFEPKSLRPVKGWLKRYRGLVATSDKGAVLHIHE